MSHTKQFEHYPLLHPMKFIAPPIINNIILHIYLVKQMRIPYSMLVDHSTASHSICHTHQYVNEHKQHRL